MIEQFGYDYESKKDKQSSPEVVLKSLQNSSEYRKADEKQIAKLESKPIIKEPEEATPEQIARLEQLEKQIAKFRVREIKELESLEKVSLKEQREDYAGLQERIEKLKEKYKLAE